MKTIKIKNVKILRKVTPPDHAPMFSVLLGDDYGHGSDIFVDTSQLLNVKEFARQVPAQTNGRCELEETTAELWARRVAELDFE